MISEFNTYLGKIDAEFWANLCKQHGELRSFKKGEEFIIVGNVAKYIGLVKKGAFKYVIYTAEGEEKVIGLETVGGFCASWPYCLRGKPSVVTIIATTDAELYCYSVSKIIKSGEENPEFNAQITQSIEEIFYTAYDRLIDLYAHSPKERYDKLLAECPRIFDFFSLKDIASFLNITPIHLSRLRKK